jgi:aminoglycoside/choline kinase family phosphotransferase
LTDAQRQSMESVFTTVIRSNLAQQRVYVHRDFIAISCRAT